MGASMKNMETQIRQIAEALQKHEKGKFPSQPEQAKAMTVFRSGRILENGEIVQDASEPIVQENEVVDKDTSQEKEDLVVPPSNEAPRLHKSSNPYVPPIPYPGRLKNTKLEQSFQDIYDILSKVNVNLPLLDAIQKMPSYVKFFKELNKDKIKFKPRQ